MAKEIIPRTAVAPDGGIYRLERRVAIEFTCEEQKNFPISRWMEQWGKEFFSTNSPENSAIDPDSVAKPWPVSSSWSMPIPPNATVGDIVKYASGINPLISKDGIMQLPMIKMAARTEELSKALRDLMQNPKCLSSFDPWINPEDIPRKFPMGWTIYELNNPLKKKE